jgi:RNA polymerase sigma-70 factor (ECF subfamily)
LVVDSYGLQDVVQQQFLLYNAGFTGNGSLLYLEDGRCCNAMAGTSGAESNELFERLYSQYADDVLRVSYFYLGDRQKAEDVCQDVFVRLLTRTPDIQPGHEKAWLLKVALNRCRDLWRAAWVKRVVLGSPFDCIPAPDDIEFRTEKTDLMEAVSRLPVAFKEVILLHYYQGFGISEIAMMLDLPEGTISSRLSRARKKLEVMLKGSGT